jgi:hypothetical protein
MNKMTYLSLLLSVCLVGSALPLMAATHSGNKPTTAPSSKTARYKQQAAYHKAMAEHYKALIAAEYAKGGQPMPKP